MSMSRFVAAELPEGASMYIGTELYHGFWEDLERRESVWAKSTTEAAFESLMESMLLASIPDTKELEQQWRESVPARIRDFFRYLDYDVCHLLKEFIDDLEASKFDAAAVCEGFQRIWRLHDEDDRKNSKEPVEPPDWHKVQERLVALLKELDHAILRMCREFTLRFSGYLFRLPAEVNVALQDCLFNLSLAVLVGHLCK